MALDPAALTIIKYPDPRLRRRCQAIASVTPEVRQVAGRMLELMHTHNGVGLAGPQVGLLWRIFVCNPTGALQDDQVLVNPQLLELEGEIVGDEGCLSIPEVIVPVRRARRARIQALNLSGESFEQDAEDLLSRIWQHENDHLNGKLILDYMDETSLLGNRRALRQLEQSFRA